VSPLKFLSPMKTDLPNLPPSPHPDKSFPIVGQVLGFDSNNNDALLQMSSCPRVKDTTTA
jgi:hypothetical protein